MLIGIDNISPGESTRKTAFGGMRHFMQSVVSYLPAAGRSHRFELFSPGWSDPFDNQAAPNLTCVPDLDVPRNRYLRATYEQLSLPSQIHRRQISVWLGTCNTLPLLARCRTALIVQSIQYLSYPESYEIARRTYLQTILRLSVRRADAIVVFSGATKKQIAARYNIDGERIRVIPHAFRFLEENKVRPADEQTEVFARTGGPYILCVSAFYPYKNLGRLVEAYASLDRPLTHKLVLVGAATEQVSADDILGKAREVGVAGHVVCLGRVSDEELGRLYRHASVMAMPSLEETFGYPVLEAMGFGCPVVTSNISSMPEIVADAGVLVDPYEVESIASGLRHVLLDQDEQRRMSAAGLARARLYTYDRFFTSLLSVLEGVGSQ